MDAFLAEATLKKLTTLDGYDYYLNVWLRECYHSRTHSGIKDTPENAYKTSKTPLRFADPEILADAFLHCETRKVDKTGCFSFEGKKYETALPLIGLTVNIIYDPTDKQTVTVEHEPTGYKGVSKELKIGPHVGERPKLPNTLLPETVETSRLLDGKEQAFLKDQANIRHAISYSGFGKDGDANV